MRADADALVEDLRELQSDAELAKVRQRLGRQEEAIGMRMGDLFAMAKAHRDLDRAEVDRLLDTRPTSHGWRRCASSTSRHDGRSMRRAGASSLRCTSADTTGSPPGTWSTVQPRTCWAASSPVRSKAPGRDLAASADPLRRRAAITAPLFFVVTHDDEGVAAGFEMAAGLAGDPEPVVHKAVGIFLKHAGTRDPAALHRFLGVHAAAMARPAFRLATAKLDRSDRARYRT